MADFEYTPIDLEGRSFRLIQLCKGEGAFVECYLFDASLHDVEGIISYEALSYTWGGTDKSYAIDVNEGRMPVTKNLYLALRHLRYKSQDRILWIDAICIDQGNDKERGHQVGQMTSIYEQAERVVIWLGQATFETDLVFDYIHQVKKEAEKRGHNNWRSSEEQWLSVGSSVQPLLGRARWDVKGQHQMGLRDLLGRSWFKRVWIIQEVAKARSAQVLCGTRSVSAYDFAMIPSMVGMRPDPHCQAILDIMPGPTRKHSWWSQNRDFYTLLLKFRDSEASDPRDVIYALLGISSDGPGSDILIPNYEKPLEEVIQDTIVFFLRLHHEACCIPCLPQWILPEFLRNLESLSDAVFIWATENGHEATVKLLLDTNKVDVNSKDRASQTPLLLAVKYGQDAIVKLLLDTNKADVNSQDEDYQTPLLLASKNGHEAIVKLLLDTNKVDVNSKDTDSQTPLFLAAKCGHEAIVKLLVSNNRIDIDLEDRHGWTPLWIAALKGYETVVKRLLKLKEGNEQTPICRTTLARNKMLAELLLKASKVDVDPKTTPQIIPPKIRQRGLIPGWAKASPHTHTPLLWAAFNGHDEILELLLKIGIDVNRKNDQVNLLLDTGKIDFESKDEVYGETPLWWAVCEGHDEIVDLLLKTGKVDFEGKDREGKTLLWRAAWNGHLAVVKLLVDTGKVNINSKDSEYGQTPLSIAAKFGHETVVKFLLNTGKVDVNSKDQNGRTPLSWAAQMGHEAIAQLLLDAGKGQG